MKTLQTRWIYRGFFNLSMEKLIVWFTPKDKKLFFNQIHVLAESVEIALKLCKENVKFEHKIMGVGKYRELDNNKFINLKIY